MVKILFLFFFAFVAQCCGVTQPIIRNTQAEGCIGDKCGMICSWEDVKLFPGETLLYRPGKCHKLYCTFGFDIRMTACSFDMTGQYVWEGRDTTKPYPDCCGTYKKRFDLPGDDEKI